MRGRASLVANDDECESFHGSAQAPPAGNTLGETVPMQTSEFEALHLDCPN
jgi:hypothetical protein